MRKEPPTEMTMPGGLVFTKDGEWVNDGAVVTHPGIADYFSRHLCFDPQLNAAIIQIDDRFVRVILEDTPFVIRQLRIGELPFTVVVNDGSTHRFDPDAVLVGSDNAFYIEIDLSARGFGRIPLRLQRGAAQQLIPCVTERDGSFMLQLGGKPYPIGRKR